MHVAAKDARRCELALTDTQVKSSQSNELGA